MELELEPCGAGAPAAGQRLLQAEAPAENEPEAVVGSLKLIKKKKKERKNWNSITSTNFVRSDAS